MIPAFIADFDLKGFTAYLVDNGARILDPTNPYEVIRYRSFAVIDDKPGGQSQKTEVHIVYRRSSGRLTYCGWSNKHYRDFQRGWDLGQAPPSAPKKKPRNRTTAKRRNGVVQTLRRRDGDDCWFCELPLGDNPTIEHLIPRSVKGGNSEHNKVLAHESCNQMAEAKPLAEKIGLKAELTRKAKAGEYEP